MSISLFPIHPFYFFMVMYSHFSTLTQGGGDLKGTSLIFLNSSPVPTGLGRATLGHRTPTIPLHSVYHPACALHSVLWTPLGPKGGSDAAGYEKIPVRDMHTIEVFFFLSCLKGAQDNKLVFIFLSPYSQATQFLSSNSENISN